MLLAPNGRKKAASGLAAFFMGVRAFLRHSMPVSRALRSRSILVM